MSLSDALLSAVVGAAVSGILVFTYQQWLQARIRRSEAEYQDQLQAVIRRLEAQLERERSFEQHSNEMLVSAYKRIWEGLVDIEDWLVRSLPTEIGKHEILLPEVVFASYFEMNKRFRAEMLFLPDHLYDRTQEVLIDLELRTNEFLDSLRHVLAARRTDPVRWERDPNRLRGVNRALNDLQESYRESLNSLRRDYQMISRDLLLGKRIPESLGSLESRREQKPPNGMPK